MVNEKIGRIGTSIWNGNGMGMDRYLDFEIS